MRTYWSFGSAAWANGLTFCEDRQAQVCHRRLRTAEEGRNLKHFKRKQMFRVLFEACSFNLRIVHSIEKYGIPFFILYCGREKEKKGLQFLPVVRLTHSGQQHINCYQSSVCSFSNYLALKCCWLGTGRKKANRTKLLQVHTLAEWESRLYGALSGKDYLPWFCTKKVLLPTFTTTAAAKHGSLHCTSLELKSEGRSFASYRNLFLQKTIEVVAFMWQARMPRWDLYVLCTCQHGECKA